MKFPKLIQNSILVVRRGFYSPLPLSIQGALSSNPVLPSTKYRISVICLLSFLSLNLRGLGLNFPSREAHRDRVSVNNGTKEFCGTSISNLILHDPLFLLRGTSKLVFLRFHNPRRNRASPGDHNNHSSTQ